MVRFVLITVLFFMTMGCAGYHNAEIAYYEAQTRAHEAYISAMKNQPPIAEMVAPDGTKFVVNNNSVVAAPAIRQMDNPALGALKTIVNSTPLSIVAGGWAGSEMIKQARGQTVNVDNGSHYETTDKTSWGHEDYSQHTHSTATPTVVNQPSPVVVTQPDPTIITQPEPIIVQQPEPIIVQQPIVITE